MKKTDYDHLFFSRTRDFLDICELPEKSTLKTVFPIPHQSMSSSLPSINARISSGDLSL